jgi:uncharacterized protein
MSSIVPRVPDIDWPKGFARYWCGNNAAATHWFNAVSFMLPIGEKWFKDVAMEVARTLDLSDNPQLRQEVRQFVAQESLHLAQHEKYNAVLEAQGYVNVVAPSIRWWRNVAERYSSPLTKLACVCAYEHYTAILAERLLSFPGAFDGHAPEMALLWGWHAAEETEHKAVCFDLYVAAGGGWFRRVGIFLWISLLFNVLFFGRAYLSLLRKDGCLNLKRLITALRSESARRSFYGPIGFPLWAALRYLSPGFHPWKHNNRAQMEAWLSKNTPHLRVVGKRA